MVKGINKLLLHVLKHLCAPDLGEDTAADKNWEKLLKTWTDHLDDTVCALNSCLLPALKYTPKELLLRLVLDTKRTPLMHSVTEVSQMDVAVHMAYVAQQHLDGYDKAVQHAIKRKTAFDHRALKHQ